MSRNALKNQLIAEIVEQWPDDLRMTERGFAGKYSDLGMETSCLDGDFTSDELRIIADSMDKLNRLMKGE